MKGMKYEYVAHHLRLGGHRAEDFLSVNPQGLVPSMVWEDGTVVSQSLAILEFIDEMQPEPPLLPPDTHGRARVRMLSQMVGCDVHPVNNLRVLNELRNRFGADDEAIANWFRHWVVETFLPMEQLLSESRDTGRFCHGDAPGLADLCLVAQVANNSRFNVDMNPYPVINRIYAACMKIPAFVEAAPSNQPDAE